MKDIKWLDDNRIQIEPPKKTKKVTGTRFASIMGLNRWSTPFEMWLAITKTYEPPFEDTIYTIAGKTIEPKQAQYMKDAYFMDILSPTDVYGKDYFQKTWGDFFPDEPICGGMWDYLGLDEDGNVDTILEMKTTKRAEDWEDDVPEYYALQAALYAYLYGVDNVIMVASFLEDSDYDHPEQFECCASNTITVEFKVSERYPNMADMVQAVTDWWNEHVVTGISPEFDEKRDAELLEVLRTNSLSPDTEIEKLVAEAEALKVELDAVDAEMAEKQKRYKKLNDLIKEHAVSQFRDGDKKVAVTGNHFTWTVSKSERTSLDKDALKADGLLDKYTKSSTTFMVKVKEN